MALETMNISLPSILKQFVERRVAEGGYGNSSEYVGELIRRDQERVAEALERDHDALNVRSSDHLKSLLEEGLQSGPPHELTTEDWQSLRDEIRQVGKQREAQAA